jgi:uncharacterized protein (DUF1684 family)
MMKHFAAYLLVFTITFNLYAQNDIENIEREILIHQETLNSQFSNPETTILLPDDFNTFSGLGFYAIDLNFRVEALLIRTPDEQPFQMQTTTNRLPWYVKYGELYFTINNTNLKLDLFQSLEPKEGFEDYLFLPFTDLTSGDGSYGGGRYIDLKVTENQTIILDFNQSYNPYCVYNPMYSCPIPPEQNDLKIRIEAGIKDFYLK